MSLALVSVSSSRRLLALRGLCALLGVVPVWALLAWVYWIAPFATVFWLLGVPAVLGLFAIGVYASRRPELAALSAALGCGVVGGLVGLIGYDAVRIPQVLVGLRPYVPIESYGILALNAGSSSALTSWAGWCINFTNGFGFGVAYGCLALGRRWYWAVPWAMFLETTTVVSPYADVYGLAGKWDLIGLAYFSHLFYAYPLGRIVEAGPRFLEALAQVIPHPAPVALAGAAVALLAWHHPFGAAGPAPSRPVLIRDGQFSPYWVRLAPGGCVQVLNQDSVAYRIPQAKGAPSLAPAQTASLCFSKPGVVRARTSAAPDAGGIVLVDPELR